MYLIELYKCVYICHNSTTESKIHSTSLNSKVFWIGNYIFGLEMSQKADQMGFLLNSSPRYTTEQVHKVALSLLHQETSGCGIISSCCDHKIIIIKTANSHWCLLINGAHYHHESTHSDGALHFDTHKAAHWALELLLILPWKSKKPALLSCVSNTRSIRHSTAPWALISFLTSKYLTRRLILHLWY